MSTRLDHANAIAKACGNPNPSQDILAALVGWSIHESFSSVHPSNNMLCCALYQSGSTPFNSFGGGMHVWNYPDMQTEGNAIASNLSEVFNGYAALKEAIATGNWSSQVAQGLKTWSGSAYGDDWGNFISVGNNHLNDDYDNNTPVLPVPPVPVEGYVTVTPYPTPNSTLNGIAQANGLTLTQLLAFSQNERYRSNPNLIYVGDFVYVGVKEVQPPAPPTEAQYVTVTPYPSQYSTLWGIATANHITLDALLAFDENSQYRSNPNLIHAGNRVRVK